MQDLVDEETQQIFEWVGAKKVPAAKVPVDGVLTTNDDETSVLSIELQAPPAPERPAAHTLLITVVDRSGSMSKFWAPQVVPALNSTAQIIWNNETTMTGHMLTYATEVTQLDLKTRASFQTALSATRASGGTHFSKAFTAIQNTLRETIPSLRKVHGTNINVVIVFMTDGADSQGSNASGVPHWKNQLNTLKRYITSDTDMADITTVFHALAFGADHDFAFLDNLRETTGTLPGGFQYAEPSDGAAALRTKLDAIVSSLSKPTVLTKLRLEVPGFLVNTGTLLDPSWHDGTSIPLHNNVMHRPGTTKTVLTLLVKAIKKIDESDVSTSNVDSAAVTDPVVSAVEQTAVDQTAVEQTESHITPVNVSAGITYVTDYYGQVMPSFPQPGSSYALYSYDPYASAASQFGPQPGMSHSFDLGPQPGMSHSFELGPQPGSSHLQGETQGETSEPIQPISSATAPAPAPSVPVVASHSHQAKADVEAEVGAEYITVKAHQVRQDDIAGGEKTAELKVRVDRLHADVDRLMLEVEKMKISLEAAEMEIVQSILQSKSGGNQNLFPRFGELVRSFERKLNDSSTFLISLGRTKRIQLNESTAAIREQFSKLHALLAEAAKGNMSTTQLARMAEVAHGAQFSKARHARTMDARTSKNAEMIDAEQKTLREHNVNIDAVGEAVYDAHDADEAEKLLREWFCVLTQDNWMNLLLDEKDVVGFGIALRRPEFVLDDPTQLRIMDISLTCVAKSAFEHVLSHKLLQAEKTATDPIQAKLAYLGGFNVEGKDLGVVVRGSANEPINAWLPLYINEEHWKVAMTQFKSTTGFLVTLNPLGYAYNQVDVYFMILAVMVVRMKVASNRQIEMTMQYLRTCAAIMRDVNGFKKRMTDCISAFVKDPSQRLKDVVPNLLVVLGYLLVLPLEDLRSLMASDGDWANLWLSLFGELSRRAIDSCSRSAHLGNAAPTLMTNLVSRLVDGYLNEEELTPEALSKVFNPEEADGAPPPPIPKDQRTFRAFSHGPSASDAQLDQKERLRNTPAFELRTMTDSGEKNSLWNAFWEAAEATVGKGAHPMEWASLRDTDDFRVMPAQVKATSSVDQSETSTGLSIVQTAISEASFHIPTQAVDALSQHFGHILTQDKKADAIASREALVDTHEIKNRQFKASAVLPKTLQAIQLCENVVANFGQPTVEGLINLMTFFTSWTTLQMLSGGTAQALADLDRNLGVAPISWLVHFREDWQRRPHVRNSFFTFLNFVDITKIPSFSATKLSSDIYNAEVLQLQILRALLAQNAKFATNKDAREAMTLRNGPDHARWMDPVSSSEAILVAYHKERVNRLIAVAAAQAAASQSSDAVRLMATTDNIYDFIGLLSNRIGTNRSTVAFNNAMISWTQHGAPHRPLAIVKLSILLSGKYVDPNSGVCVTIVGGRAFVPGRKKLSAFHRTWGPTFKAVEAMVNLTFARAPKAPAHIHLDTANE